ncbi:MAG: hypothetical protein H6719_29725 [Sandaracinaceae bacterium]|nr:hypothetical protein [Sandaracinaceae bacterium]
MTTPSDDPLISVFCVDDDEVYATGREGDLLKGSAYGWTKILRAETGLHGVAKWRGDVWVGGAPPVGLCKLDGDALDQVRPFLATDFDTRGNLLFRTNDFIAQTADGVAFEALPLDDFMDLVQHDPPSWR